MARISLVEVHEFTYNAKDIGLGPGLSPVYMPGENLAMKKLAVAIETVDGVRGEYVPLWSSPPTAVGQTLVLGKQLIGMDATDRERIFSSVRHRLRKHDFIGYGALDIALWDAAGKEYGAPIAALLGRYRTALPAYASTLHADSSGPMSSPGGYADFAEQCFELGYRAFKIHGYGHTTGRAEAEIVTEVADRMAGRMALMTDPASGLQTFAEALHLGRACDDAGFYWLEDPLASISQAAHRKLRQLIRTPLLITEHVRDIEPKSDFAAADATDFLRADPELDLGITGTMKIAHIAEGFGLDVELHAAGPAHRHCMAAIRNTNYYEVALVHPTGGNPLVPPVYADDYSDDLEAVRPDGTFGVPSGPGLGVTYDWDYIGRHTTQLHRFTAEERS